MGKISDGRVPVLTASSLGVEKEPFVLREKKCAVLFILLLIIFIVTGCTRSDSGKAPDKTPPTVPNGISITAVSSSEVKVSWKPSADDTGVKGYKIYRNGAYFKKTTDATSMMDTGLKPKTKYCYRVSAYDGSGNESAQSTDVCAVL
jgi:Fibronectin type III domain